MDWIGPRFFFCLKRRFVWENWLPLLFSTGRSWDIRCWSFGPNWTQITHLPLQGKFLSTSDTPSQYYNVLKKIIKVDHKIQGCIIFGQIGQRHFLGGKLIIVTFVNLLCPILLKCLNLKYPYRESWDIRFSNSGQSWNQITEFSLLGQGIRRSTGLAKHLLILSPTTRKNPPFIYSPFKCLSPSTKY